MSDFPSDLSAFADPNNPSHELYLAFTDFIKDNAGVFAAALAANAVDTTSRMLMASPSVQRTIAGIPGPLGALTSMFSRLAISNIPDSSATVIQTTSQEGSSLQTPNSNSDYDKMMAKFNTSGNGDLYIDKTKINIAGQTSEKLALKSVFAETSGVEFLATMDEANYLHIGYDQEKMLVAYFSNLWGITGLDALKEPAILMYKKAVSEYLKYRYKNQNKTPHAFEKEFDVFVAELTKTVAIVDWRTIVLKTVLKLKQSVIDDAKEQLRLTLVRHLPVVGLVISPTPLPDAVSTTYNGEYLSRINDDIKDYYDTLANGGTEFEWWKQKTAQLTWQTWGVSSLNQVKQIKAYGIQYASSFIGNFFHVVKGHFNLSGEILSGAFHDMMRVGTSATNIHHMYEFWNRFAPEFSKIKFTDAALKTEYGRFITNYNSTLLEEDLPIELRNSIGVIRDWTALVKDHLATDQYGTYSESAIREFIDGLFIQRCNADPNCDNTIRKTFVEFFLIMSIQERFDNMRLRRQRDTEHELRIATETTLAAERRQWEESQQRHWYQRAWDTIMDSTWWAAVIAGAATQVPTVITYMDSRNRQAQLDAESRLNRETTQREFGELRQMFFSALQHTGTPAITGANNSGLNDAQLAQINSLYGASRAISQSPEVVSIARQAATELDNSGIIDIAHSTGEFLGRTRNEADWQTSGAPPTTLTPGLPSSLDGIVSTPRHGLNENRSLSQGIASAAATPNPHPPMAAGVRYRKQKVHKIPG